MTKTREPKPADTQGAARFKPRPCRACKALSKKRCMFCGQSWNRAKQDMTDWEILLYDAHVDKIAWLQKLYDQLVNLKQKKFNVKPENDGKLSSLEDEILAWIGDWRNK